MSAIQTETVEYKQGETTLEGCAIYDPSNPAKRPGVLIVHQWFGITDHEKSRGEMLAKLGYVAFCADIYGKGIRPKSVEEASATITRFKSGDRKLLRARVNAALDALKKHPLVDPKRTAAIGFCFGGTTVIELARNGADVGGVVSFHGGLDSPNPADGRNIKCKVLALAGAEDPFQNPDDLQAFEKEMRDCKADWQAVFYGNTVHAFTQPDPGFENPGAKYNEKADKRSWEAMKSLFAEIFK